MKHSCPSLPFLPSRGGEVPSPLVGEGQGEGRIFQMKRKVAIVDDNPEERFVLKGILKDLGCEVIGEGATGLEAVELAQRLNPDVILMDIKMPGMNGVEAATIINQLQPVPIIIFTGRGDEETVRRTIEAGVMAYLVKPVREEGLLPAIELAISRFKEFQALRKEVQDLKGAMEARKVIERAKGLLMEKEGINEREAFSRIQRMSMDMRRPMKDVAEKLITALEGRK